MVLRERGLPNIRPSVLLNNDGQLSTGRLQGNFGLDVDNALGVGDFWSAYFTRAIENGQFRGSEGYGGFVSLPYGYWTASANVGRFTYESVLNANGQQFLNDGESSNASFTLDRLLYRDARTKIGVAGSLALIDTENRIQGIRLATSSYRLATGSVDARIQYRTANGLLTGGIGVTTGLDILGAQSADTGPDGPGLAFTVIDANVGYRQPVKVANINTNYSIFIRGQSALGPVFAANRFNLGGSSTVRGFRDDGLSGRSGIALRQQLDFPLLETFPSNPKWRGGLSGFVGYDAGGIFSRGADAFERGFLHSAVLGARYASQWLNLEILAARPLDAPSFVLRRDIEFAFTARIGI